MAADFTPEPIGDSLRFWVREMGWDDEVRFAAYGQAHQALLDPDGPFARNTQGVNVVLLRDTDSDLAAAVRGHAAPLIVMTADQVLGRYPVEDVFDEHAEELGDVPFTPLFFTAMGTAVARAIHAMRMAPYKAIALDCDNTLWRGTCGEDGPAGVTVDAPRRGLQDFMLRQREMGMLLAICSKNNDADVRETFQAHPEMPLRWEHFVARKISWDSKSAGLTGIAEELGLGLDSLLLIDDSAKEIAEVRAACPEVTCIELPHSAGRIPHFLEHVWAFDHARVTDEDRARNASYAAQAERGKAERGAATLAEFIAQLGLEIHIREMSDAQVPRVAQLTQRTNQMNTTLVRLSEDEVRGAECLVVDVSDRFGSYGLVGAMFLREDGETLHVDGLLLSCRALGRGVEHRMLAHVGELALAKCKRWVRVDVVEGPRNQPARDFVGGLPAPLSAAVCARIAYTPSAERPQTSPLRTGDSSRAMHDYGRIARELARPGQVQDAIRGEKRKLAAERGAVLQPRTEMERRLAAIWSDVLHVPSPGVDEDFFDLGGHSLLAVQLLTRVRRETGVELTLDVVYGGRLTIESMAAAMELAQADPEEVRRLLAEIDALSEDEIRELL